MLAWCEEYPNVKPSSEQSARNGSLQKSLSRKLISYHNSQLVTCHIVPNGISCMEPSGPQEQVSCAPSVRNRNSTCETNLENSAPQSENAVCTNIKYSRYSQLTSNFLSIPFHAKRLYVHNYVYMFQIVHTPYKL